VNTEEKDLILQEAITKSNPKYKWVYLENGYGWTLVLDEINGSSTEDKGDKIVWCEKHGWITQDFIDKRKKVSVKPEHLIKPIITSQDQITE
jgi:mRNA degradation ribonuclease J1/J2